jgi:hypothetical protein
VRGPRAAIFPVTPGRQGEGPGRENSLASLNASLTNSLSHPRRIGITRPVVPNYCELVPGKCVLLSCTGIVSMDGPRLGMAEDDTVWGGSRSG